MLDHGRALGQGCPSRRPGRRSQPRVVDDDPRKRDPERLLLRIRRAVAELRNRMVSGIGQPRRKQHLPARDVADAGRHGERRRARLQLRDRRPVHPGRRRVDAAQLRRPQRRHAMLLIEGNDGLGAGTDNIHGTHHFLTFFRNHFHGDPNKTANTATMHLWAYSRFFNIVGNVLGRPGYYTTYETNLSTDDVDIYSFGQPDSGASGDSRTRETAMRWGNYDTVSASFRFDAAEVPTGLTNFANSVPATHVLPPSLYLSAKPSWWGTVPWPAIGPDVAGGDIPGYGGHVYKIPARRCYENAAIDPAYGSSGVRIFDPET